MRKYADGGLTPQDKENWNAYHSWMARNNPDYGTAALDHAAKPGTTPYLQQWNAANPNQAVNRPIQDYQQEFTTTPLGRSKIDNYGAAANQQSGRQTTASSFKKYEYEHYDKNGKLIGHINPTTEALTQDQVNDWAGYNRGQQWQSNDQNIPMPSGAPWQPKPATPVAPSAVPAFDKNQAIANRQAREADTTGRYANMYEAGPAPTYGVDDVRASTVNQGEMDYYNNKQYDMNGAVMGRGGVVLYRTPLPNKAYWPNTPTYGKGGKIKCMDGGGTMNDGRGNLSPDSPTGAAQGPALPDPGDNRWTPQAPPTGVQPPPPPMAPPMNADYSQNTPTAAPAQAAPQTKHNYVGFSTQGLVMGGLQGADALVTEAIYNPKVRAREAQRQRDMSQAVTGPTDFYGNGTGMYGNGGKVKDEAVIRQGKPIPEEGVWDWIKHKVRGDLTPQTEAAQNKRYTKPVVDALRVASAAGQFVPHPLVRYPSMAVNSMLGAVDVYDDYKRGDQTAMAQDALFALPIPAFKAMKPAKAAASLERLGAAVNAGGVVNDVSQVQYGAGGKVSDFETMPGRANALVESQEELQMPDGSLMSVPGDDFHSDKPNGMGGKYMELPPETRVYSKKKLIDKDVASAIMDRKITKKSSPAELVRRFDTKREEEVLDSKHSDPISSWTADFMKGIKDGKKEQVFTAQEVTKNPFYGMQMGYGGRVGHYGPGGLINVPPGPSETWADAHPSGDYPIPGMVQLTPQGPLSPANPIPGAVNVPAMPPNNALSPAYPTSDEPVYLDGPTDNSYESQVPWAGNNYTPPPAGAKEAPKGKTWGKLTRDYDANLRDLPLYAPEALATIHAMTDQPIFSQKFQPVYNRANTLNVQADLNRNLSMAYPMLQRSYGNAGVDSGRRNASLATLVDAANQLGQQKANYDSNQRVQTNNQNAAIENDANWKNIQLATQMSDKMAQRQFNKERSLENITQSATDKAYALKHGRKLEKNSLDILNQMYPHWKYGPNGLAAQQQGPWFHNPYGNMGSQGGMFDPGDGIRDSETVTIGGKKYKRVESDRN